MRLIVRASILAVALILLPAKAAKAQDTYGGWEFMYASHNFGNTPWYTSLYFEHDNVEYNQLDCWFLRSTWGYKITDWLKTDVACDYFENPTAYAYRGLFNVTATLRQGNLTASARQRFIHSWFPETRTESSLLRTFVKVSYAIPETRFSPYVAAEYFYWGREMKKIRYYAACCYDFTDNVQFECYYLRYTSCGIRTLHLLGVGLNFTL